MSDKEKGGLIGMLLAVIAFQFAFNVSTADDIGFKIAFVIGSLCWCIGLFVFLHGDTRNG